MGDLSINGRRGRKEEFNPFAKDASQQHRRRREDRERQHNRRPTPAPVEAPVNQPTDIKADLERKQREAMEKLEQKGDVSAPVVTPAPLPVEAPKKSEEKPLVQSHEDRLAELRRKSQEAKMSASRIEATPEPSIATLTVEPSAGAAQSEVEPVASSLQPSAETIAPAKRAKNVFAKIETKVEVKPDRRRRRRMDKKGGGRQKQEKKLNRQKYLEYKYAAKDILDNPNVPEEHRSNVLGQIWAKGERQGIDDCLDYIDQKEAELILPEEVGTELKNLVKRMTTKR